MASSIVRFGGRSALLQAGTSSSRHPAAPRALHGLQKAAKMKLASQSTLAASYSFLHQGQRYRLISTSYQQPWNQCRSYFSSRTLFNTEEKKEETNQEEVKQETKREEPAWAPKGALVQPEWPPFGRWPYAWIGLTIASLFMFGYTWFIMREEKMIDRYEFIKWGGDLDRIHSLKKIRKYLIFDTFGIVASGRMSNFGLAEVTAACFTDPNPKVRALAVEVFCGFTANEELRPYLIEKLRGVEGLRRFANDRNLHMWHALGNLAQGNEAVCKEIANDEYVMDSLFDMYERALSMNDMYFVRPIVRLLATLSEFPESSNILSTTYQEKLDRLMSVFLIPEAQSMANNLNLRLRLAKNNPRQWPELVGELASSGIHEEETPRLYMYSMIHQALAVGVVGFAWSFFRSWRLAGKFDPLSRSERAWIKRAFWRSPLAAILLSFSWNGLEQVSGYVSKQLSWDEFRDARYAYLPYFALLPTYWVALNFIGPFATIPSLVRIRYRETMPPYNYALREPLLDLFETIGLIEDRHIDPMQRDRFTTNLGEVALQNQIVRQKLKEDAEWVANQEKKSKKWFGIW